MDYTKLGIVPDKGIYLLEEVDRALVLDKYILLIDYAVTTDAIFYKLNQ